MARPLDPAEAFNRQPAVPRGTPLRTPNVPSELELAKDALRQTRPGTAVGPNPTFSGGQRAVGGAAPSASAGRMAPVVQATPSSAPAFTPETRGDVLARESMLRNQAASRASRVAPAPAVTEEGAKAGRWRQLASKVPGAQSAKTVAGTLRAGGGLAMGAVAPAAAAAGAYGRARDAQTVTPIAGGSAGGTVPTLEQVQAAQSAPGFEPRSALQEFTPAAIADSLSNPGFAMSLGPAGSAMSGASTALRNVGGRAAGMAASVLGPTAVTGIQAGDALGAEMGNRAGPRTPGAPAPMAASGAALPIGGPGATTPGGIIEINGQRLSPERMAQLESRSQSSGIDFGRQPGQGSDISSVLRDMMGGGNRGSGGSAQGAVIAAPGNDAFDKLKAEVIAAHDGGRVAKGTLAKKLMQIEEMRQGRQTADQQNATGMRGQDLAAQSAAANTRANLANTMADYDVQSQAAQSSALRNKAEATKFQSEMGEKGFDRFQKLTTGLFQKVGEDGKPTNDTAKEERFRQYLMGSDMANADGGLLTLDPQQQAALISQQRASFEMQEAANEKSGNWGGVTSNRYSPATNVRDPELGDLRRGLGVRTYLNQELNPFSDGNVVQQENGQVRSRSELVDDDADRLAELQNALRSRR